MTRGERERLIQRYLNGEMSSTEESDFFIQVALDKELRQDLKAQRTIESAFRKDRESEPSEHTALRSRVAMILAASTASVNAPNQAPAAGDGTKIPEQAPTMGRFGRLVTGSGRLIITSTAALVLTVGILFMLPGDEPVTPTTPSPGLVAPGASKSSPNSSTDDPARAPMSRSVAAPNGSQGMRTDGAASKENNAKNNPPASVSSDGVSLGSAAQAPRRTSQPFDGSASRADRPRSSESTTLQRSTRTRSGATSSSANNATSASTSSIDNSSTQPSDGRTVDPSRSRKLGSDSIDAGVTVRLKRPMRK